MKNKIIIFLAIFACFFCVQTAFSAGAFGLDKTAVQAGYETEGTSASIEGRIQVAISAFLGLMALVFFGLTLYGGIIWLTARGKEESITKAKGILEAAIIGLIVVVFSYAIATFVLRRVTGVSQSGESKICTTMDHRCTPILTDSDEQKCIADGDTVEIGTCD